MAKRTPKNSKREKKAKPRKKRDMRKFAEKLWDDMKKISSPLEKGQLAIDRATKLTPEEYAEFHGWLRAMNGPVSSLNIGM